MPRGAATKIRAAKRPAAGRAARNGIRCRAPALTLPPRPARVGRAGRRGMRVMKFGGTSVGIPANFATAVSLVVERLPVQPLVVVSALHGVTNLLVDYARDPLARQRHSTELVDRHLRFLLAAGLD